MAKKVIIQNGKKTNYAVIYGERTDPQTGKRYLKKKRFRNSEEADEFLKQLVSIKEVIHVEVTMDQKDEE